MFKTVRIAAAAAMALLAATGAQASTTKDTSSWVNAEVATPGDSFSQTDPRFAARAGINDDGAAQQLASRTGINDHAA